MTARRPVDLPATPTFDDLGVSPVLSGLLAAKKITTPFPIQAATLPDSLAGRDVLGKGRTGSGKTYAFVLAVLGRLAASPTKRRPGKPRALILAPTRELVTQIDAALAPLANALSLRTMTIFGGVGAGRQVADLRAGVDVVVACPGRLEDHATHGAVDLSGIEITVLDEADHMADLGFLPVVKRLLDRTPRDGQRLLFSATLDSGVDVLVKRYLHNPVMHDADPTVVSEPASTHHVLYIQESEHLAVLVDLTAAPGRSIVFTRTKHRAKALTRKLVASGVPAVELHGNLAQNARDRNLTAFTAGTATTLVATDIAARGIHVDDVRIIIHADPPAEHKAYVHRSGRTARAGATGTVITLSTDAQRAEVRDLTRRAGVSPTATRISPGHPLLSQLAPGQRTFVAAPPAPEPSTQPTRAAGTGRSRSGRGPATTSPKPVRTHNGSANHAAPAPARSGGRSRSATSATAPVKQPTQAAGQSGPTAPGSAAAFSKSHRPRRRSGA